jgi:hypothetical protein
MGWLLLAALPLAQPPAPEGPIPLETVLRIVHADLAALPESDRCHYRYLDFHNVQSVKDRLRFKKILDGHLQHLSREPDLVPLVYCDPRTLVVRLDLRDYGLDPKVYEKLAEADPYYHVKIEREVDETYYWKGGRASDGRDYKEGTYPTGKKAKRKVAALAPILTDCPNCVALLSDLAKWSESSVFLLKADWFFNQTAAAQNRTPNYYDFLGVKSEKDFQRLIGFDAKLNVDFRLTEHREAVSDSEVTEQPRALRRDEKVGGGYWRSFDFELAQDRRNPLRVLGKDIEADYQASEQYGHLPNGFWATGIFNRQGVPQAAAPGQIASDSESKSNDKQVHVNASCYRCHKKGGLRDIDGWVRGHLAAPPLKLNSPDPDLYREQRRQYGRKLEAVMEADRLRHATAVKEVTGWTAEDYADHYGAFWERYEDSRPSLAWAAADLGVKAEGLEGRLLEYLQKTGNIDPVVSVYVKDLGRQRGIKVRQYEESFALIYLANRGAVVAPDVKVKK